MKLLREKILGGPGSFILPLLAAVLVVSISFHSHAPEEESGPQIRIADSGHGSSHPVNDCFTCLIQGNIKLPDIGPGLTTPIPIIISTLEEAQFLLPTSYLNTDKPSRSPPAV